MLIAYDINGIRLSRFLERERCTVRFIFDDADPAAVQLIFGDMDPASIDVSRFVLCRAVFDGERVGGGRFAVERAWDTYAGESLLAHLRGTVDGEPTCTHVLFSLHSVTSFLNTTLEKVPLTEEKYDIDAVIERLLS